MTKTITGTISSGYTLSNAAYTPFYVDPAASLTNPAGIALLDVLAANWTGTNAGNIAGSGPSGAGFVATAGGALTNNGHISGYVFGVSINGAGSVANHGSISSAKNVGSSAYYSAATHALIPESAGVAIAGGGVANYANATITGPLVGVAIGGLGSVVNAGVILGVNSNPSASSGYGVILEGGGSVANQTGGQITGGQFGVVGIGQVSVSNQSGGTISANNIGIAGFYLLATVVNQGAVEGSSSTGIDLVAGGAVTNQTGGSISGGTAGVAIAFRPGTVDNQGTITNIYALQNQASHAGQFYGLTAVTLNAGGTVINGGQITGHSYGVAISGTQGATATVTNSGTIISNRVDGGSAVRSSIGGLVSNSGQILAGSYGVYLGGSAGATGTVTNTGTIISYQVGTAAGVRLASGGSVTNSQGGLIAGEFIGLQLGSLNPTSAPRGPLGSLTFVNQGSVIATDGRGDGAAVWMYGPGTIINDPGGVIAGATHGTISGDGPFNGIVNGGFGIVAYYQTTVINFGSIGGVLYNASYYNAGVKGPKQFAFDASNKVAGNTVTNLIEIAPGSSFGGVVKGADQDGSASLELLSGASAGSVVSFGKVTVSGAYYSGYLGFGAVKIDDGARWTLGGTVTAGVVVSFASGGTAKLTFASPASVQGTIAGFAHGDTIGLAGVTVTGTSFAAGVLTKSGFTPDVLTLNEASGSISLYLAGGFTANEFRVTNTPGVGADVTLVVPCFAAGTRIGTVDGTVAVEDLAIGDRVLLADGGDEAVVWIGTRAVDCAHHPRPGSVWPVKVAAGAFGPNAPSRDLWLSPDHAVFVNDVLIPVRCLINGETIRQIPVPDVTYYHVELPAHDVILAEDLPVESYLDTGDRGNFSNARDAVRLFPDFSARMWEMAGRAPLVMAGPIVEDVKRALQRAVHRAA